MDTVRGYGFDSTGSGQVLMAGDCESCNAPSVLIKGEEYNEKVSNY
jgi:hypothetical protein